MTKEKGDFDETGIKPEWIGDCIQKLMILAMERRQAILANAEKAHGDAPTGETDNEGE
jgi:hypothetical protein